MSDRIYFYIDKNKIQGNKFTLSTSESHHFTNVLRKPPGTEIWLTDGIGTVYKSLVDKIEKQVVSGSILQKYSNFGENKFKVNLGIGILKRDKMELVAEKATECGINKIIPLIMDRSIKRNVNMERLQKIILTATKQCGRSVKPDIVEPIKLHSYLVDNSASIIAVHNSGQPLGRQTLAQLDNPNDLFIIVGPEGDFSDNELDLLRSEKAVFANLGNRRLRSETAVIAALSQINLIFN